MEATVPTIPLTILKWLLKEASPRLDMLRGAYKLIMNPSDRFGELTCHAIQNGEHLQQILTEEDPQSGQSRTRVLEKMPDFLEKTCKNATMHIPPHFSNKQCGQWPFKSHWVLFMGLEKQEKSLLVDSILEKERSVTSAEEVFDLKAEGVGTIRFVDPNLRRIHESHEQRDLWQQQVDKDVFSGLVVLVLVGNSRHVVPEEAVRDSLAEINCYDLKPRHILPVVTQGDMADMVDVTQGDMADMVDVQDLNERLRQLADFDSSLSQTVMLDLMVVQNHAWQDEQMVKGKGIEGVKKTILNQVKKDRDCLCQMTKLLTQDFISMMRDFHYKHPDEETERRLFHLTVEGLLATYGREAPNIECVPKVCLAFASHD